VRSIARVGAVECRNTPSGSGCTYASNRERVGKSRSSHSPKRSHLPAHRARRCERLQRHELLQERERERLGTARSPALMTAFTPFDGPDRTPRPISACRRLREQRETHQFLKELCEFCWFRNASASGKR
jgi:hypothetical protein